MPAEPGQGVCRRFPAHAFREVETVQAEGGSPQITIRLHAHYGPVTLTDPGCGEYRPRRGPLGRFLHAAAQRLAAL